MHDRAGRVLCIDEGQGGAPVAAAASETAADTERATAVGLGGCVVVG